MRKNKLISCIAITLFLFLFIPLSVKAATSVNLFQITTDGSQQKDPIIYNDLVAYTNYGGSGGIDIWIDDLKNNENYPVIEKAGQQFLTGFEDNLIVYEDVDDTTLTSDVRLYNLKTKQDIPIATGSGSQGGGVTNGKEIIYINGGACGTLNVYNLKTKTTAEIYPLTCSPIRISGDIVVFPASDPHGTNIRGYDLKKKQVFDIATDDGFQESPNIFDDNVVWLHYTTGAYGDYNAIVIKNLRTKKQNVIYQSSTDTLQYPAISNKYIVWSQSSAQHVGGVMGANIKTGEVFEIQAQGSHQNSHTTPSILKDTAAWMAWRTGNGDIYGAILSK